MQQDRNDAESRLAHLKTEHYRYEHQIDEFMSRLTHVRIYPPTYDDDRMWKVRISLNISEILPALDRGNDSVIEYISQSVARQLGNKLRDINRSELNRSFSPRILPALNPRTPMRNTPHFWERDYLKNIKKADEDS